MGSALPLRHFLPVLLDFLPEDFPVAFFDDDFDPPARFGSPLRLVCAISSSCFSLIDPAMLLEAPLSDFFGASPRFAASAAPAAICCFFDFAGIL